MRWLFDQSEDFGRYGGPYSRILTVVLYGAPGALLNFIHGLEHQMVPAGTEREHCLRHEVLYFLQ